jgi:predicted RecA/RadA family phage recombinase
LPNIELEKEGTIILNVMDMNSGYLIWIGYADAINSCRQGEQGRTITRGCFPNA